MLSLPHTYPHLYQKFVEGYHVVGRSDHYWAGLSTDLVIEQVIMSLKTQGGLTRGKGMTDIQRLLWVLSMPACTALYQTMQVFTSVCYTTSDQHKDLSKQGKSEM